MADSYGKNKNQFRPKDWKRNHDFRENGRSNNVGNSVAGISGANNRNGKSTNKLEARRPIGFKTLENVLKIDGDAELILKLSSEMNGFLLLLDQKDIRPEFMCLVLSALAKVSECSAEQDTVQLLVHFYMKIMPKLSSNANFYRELIMYTANLRTLTAEHSSQRQKHVNAVQDLLLFLRRLQTTIYQRSFDAVQDLVHQVASQIDYINKKGNSLNDSIVELLAQLKESVDNFDQMREETEKSEVLLEPPENFRKIPIYPTVFDILRNHEPFIRENIVGGKYAGGIDHYLDTQFRLLREDFVRPLRYGISKYVQIKNKPEAMAAAKGRINDLNLYKNVQICSSKMVHSEQVHLCVFDSSPFQHLRWQVKRKPSFSIFNSKRKSLDFAVQQENDEWIVGVSLVR